MDVYGADFTSRPRRGKPITCLRCRLEDGGLRAELGFAVAADARLYDDPGGDQLDALLCAVQASWAWRNRVNGYGAPDSADPLEGWIADPLVTRRASHPGTS